LLTVICSSFEAFAESVPARPTEEDEAPLVSKSSKADSLVQRRSEVLLHFAADLLQGEHQGLSAYARLRICSDSYCIDGDCDCHPDKARHVWIVLKDESARITLVIIDAADLPLSILLGLMVHVDNSVSMTN